MKKIVCEMCECTEFVKEDGFFVCQECGCKYSVEEAKKARNEANNKIKSLEWSSGKRDKIKIENEIKKIDKIIETRVLDIKKENQLVKNANDLRKQLMEIHEDETVKSEAQELKKLSEEEHEKVISLSEQAQAAH